MVHKFGIIRYDSIRFQNGSRIESKKKTHVTCRLKSLYTCTYILASTYRTTVRSQIVGCITAGGYVNVVNASDAWTWFFLALTNRFSILRQINDNDDHRSVFNGREQRRQRLVRQSRLKKHQRKVVSV